MCWWCAAGCTGTATLAACASWTCVTRLACSRFASHTYHTHVVAASIASCAEVLELASATAGAATLARQALDPDAGLVSGSVPCSKHAGESWQGCLRLTAGPVPMQSSC